jgi:hypothetical protein
MDSTTYSKTQNFIYQESEFGAKNKPLVIVLAWPKRNLCHYSSQVNMQVPSEVTPSPALIASEALKLIKGKNISLNYILTKHHLKYYLVKIASSNTKKLWGKGKLIGVELKKSSGGARMK